MSATSQEELSFQIILNAGNSRTMSLEALELSRKGNIQKAEQLLKEASLELNKAHEVQTKMLSEYANGVETVSNILLTHAQDHVVMATLTLDLAKELIILRKEGKK